jgi:hypothetical protein
MSKLRVVTIIAAEGRKLRVLWAMSNNGRMPAKEFYDKKMSDKERAKILALFKRFAAMGSISNKEQFKPLGEGLFEFKNYQLRFIGKFGPSQGDFSVGIGLKKKRGKHKQSDLRKAQRILDEYFDACR